MLRLVTMFFVTALTVFFAADWALGGKLQDAEAKRADFQNRYLGSLPGTGSVKVTLDVMNDEQRTELRKLLRGDAREPVIPFAQPGSLTRVYAVASGKGGVGKSSITVNLAAALAAGGKRTSHLIEQLFPAEGLSDPAGRGWISWTERRHNRAALRESILRQQGEAGEARVEEHDRITLLMTEEVRRSVDERRILESDIQRVIDHAETSGKKLHNATSGVYRGYLKFGNVTFWVEYTPTEGGYRVHNAYCHRMNIVGTKL